MFQVNENQLKNDSIQNLKGFVLLHVYSTPWQQQQQGDLLLYFMLIEKREKSEFLIN